ncbi:hypothetical protein EP331_06175 [bacterium]|nr:MAG: hypothetical protein EP331_06175 [bacterium]
MKLRLLLLLVLIPILFSCSEKKKNNEAVASWNGYSLTADKFTQSYINYVLKERRKDTPELRAKFAEYELERKIIAQKAQELGLDTLFEVQSDIIQKTENTLRQVYMRHFMDERVQQPVENEIRQAFKRIYTAMRLEQIFAPTQTQIDAYYKELQKGASFEKVAKQSLSLYSSAASDTSYKLGWVRYGMIDLSAEITAFNLKKGSYSKPVKSTKGWHIFKATDILETERVHVEQYKNNREQLLLDVFRRKLEESTQFFIDSLYAEQQVVIRDALFQAVITSFQQVIKKQPIEAHKVLLRKAAGRIAKTDTAASEIAVLNGKSLPVEQFLQAVHTIPSELIEYEPQQALSYWLKNILITDLAKKNGYMKNQEVVKEQDDARFETLYYAHLRYQTPLLDKQKLAHDFYESYKEQRYPDSVSSTYHAYLFSDSSKVAELIKLWQKERYFTSIIPLFKDDYTLENRTTTSKVSETEGKPEHYLPMDEPQKNQVFAGPYKEGSLYMLIAPVSRKIIPIKEEALGDRLINDTNSSLSALTHKYCLPEQYKKADVTINTALLQQIISKRNQ